MLLAIINPKLALLGAAEKPSTENPATTTAPLNKIARPVVLIASTIP